VEIAAEIWQQMLDADGVDAEKLEQPSKPVPGAESTIKGLVGKKLRGRIRLRDTGYLQINEMAALMKLS